MYILMAGTADISIDLSKRHLTDLELKQVQEDLELTNEEFQELTLLRDKCPKPQESETTESLKSEEIPEETAQPVLI